VPFSLKEKGNERRDVVSSTSNNCAGVNTSMPSTYVRINGRLALFKRAADRDYWDALRARTTDSQLKWALRPTKNLGVYGSWFRQWLPQEGLILEAGCGNGLWVSRLQENGYDCIGLDFAVDALRRTHEVKKTLPLIGGDLTRLPFGDEAFSGYLSIGVIEHFRNGPQSLLKEAKRVLKKGGILCISVPYENYSRKRAPLSEEEEAVSHGLEFYQYYYQLEDLNRELSEAGFLPLKASHRCHVNLGLKDLPILSTPLRHIFESRMALGLDFIPLLPFFAAHAVFAVAVRP
jgi:SAM-dependent methyltransferase